MTMTTEIDLKHFPGPGHYASDSLGPTRSAHLPISIFALHVQLVTQDGNILSSEQSKGYYFFRDSHIPLPRACTVLAWNRICVLGKPDSKQYYLPFLPSLREEDEVGSAIGERGSRIASLSRKSKYHMRDSEDRVVWGPVYGSQLGASNVLWQTERSDFAESLVTDSMNFIAPATHESIRDRMTFLAQHGFPATNALMKHLNIPRIYRLLFQFLDRSAVQAWVSHYNSSMALVKVDPDSIAADFKDMTHQMVEARKTQKEESDEVSDDNFADSPRRNKIPKNGRFSGIGDMDF
jgi:hypothetical protein